MDTKASGSQELLSLASKFPEPNEPKAAPTVPIPVLRGHFAGVWAAMSGEERRNFLSSLGAELTCPIIEKDPFGDPQHRLFTFLHRNRETTAVVLSANALVDHRRVEDSEFEPLGTDGLWALTYRQPANWECGYRITAHQGPGLPPWRAETQRRPIRLAADAGGCDPFNPAVGAAMNGGAISVLRGPGAPQPAWLATAHPRREWAPSIMGTGAAEAVAATAVAEPERIQVWDSLAGRERTVWLYRPPAAAYVPPTPLLILHDGQVWARYLDLASTLDSAINAGVIPALHVAMIDSLDVQTRTEELGGPVGSVDFVARDLLPRLRAELPVSDKATDTIVSGASFGGLASLWQLARFPELVGCAIAQSPSLWRYDLIAEMLGVAPRVRVFLQAGQYETDIHETSLALHRALVAAEADVDFVSISGGHDWSWWNPWLIHGLAQAMAPAPPRR